MKKIMTIIVTLICVATFGMTTFAYNIDKNKEKVFLMEEIYENHRGEGRLGRIVQIFKQEFNDECEFEYVFDVIENYDHLEVEIKTNRSFLTIYAYL